MATKTWAQALRDQDKASLVGKFINIGDLSLDEPYGWPMLLLDVSKSFITVDPLKHGTWLEEAKLWLPAMPTDDDPRRYNCTKRSILVSDTPEEAISVFLRSVQHSILLDNFKAQLLLDFRVSILTQSDPQALLPGIIGLEKERRRLRADTAARARTDSFYGGS